MNPLDLMNATTPPAQDFIVLGGEKSPGRATPVGAGSPRKWDKQGGYGISGATLLFTGDDLSEFDVIIDLWELEHWIAWAKFARVLEKSPIGTRPKALEIIHPLLNRAPLKITQVVIRDVTQFERSPKGMWTCRIMLTTYRAPLPALGKPDGTIPRASAPIDPFGSDPVIKDLVAKQAALGGAL